MPPPPKPSQCIASSSLRPTLRASSCVKAPRRHENQLIHRTEQLGLEYELALLVLLARLVRLVVLPPDRLLALPARDVPHDVPARRHVAFRGF